MTFLNNKNILYFGPANNFDKNTDLSYFNNYDIVFINNKLVQLIQPNLLKFKKKFTLILILNGVFTNGNPETIKNYVNFVDLYFVSETNLIYKLENIGIKSNRIVNMANNYKKFNFDGCPNMFPKLLMLFIDNNVDFNHFKITGITFYMELISENSKIANNLNSSSQNLYHKNYHNWDTKIPKELSHLTDSEKMEYHLNKIKNNGTKNNDSLDSLKTNVHSQKHYIIENFKFFLNYYNQYEDKMTVDSRLKNIIDEYNNFKILCLIPARSGSKGIIDKNIMDFNGKPLIFWSIDQALNSKHKMKIVVSTDSNNYKKIIDDKYDNLVPFLRPSDISNDDSLDIEFTIHALEWLIQNQSYKPDIILHLRPTCPLRGVDDIDKALDLFIENRNDFDSLRSVIETEKSPYKMYSIVNNNLVPLFDSVNKIDEPFNQPRQKLPKTYLHNGYIDIFNYNLVSGENKSISGKKILPFLMNEKNNLDIDTPNDLKNI